MLDTIVLLAQIVIGIMPFFSVAATIYLGLLWWNSGKPRNKVLRTATITSTLVTLGGIWWAVIAMRRAFLGPEVGALFGEYALLFYAASLLLILATPLVKVVEIMRISKMPLTQEQIDNLRRLEYSLIQDNPTQDQVEDKRFGDERRALERQHNIDNE